jgi:5-methylcytosine-specific restriction protein A
VFASGEIGMRHVEVIAALLGTSAAERLPTGTWADAERQLAAHAPDYTPAELHTWGTQLISLLDQDGPEPDDRPDPQINELHITRHKNRPGGSIRARFEDPEMFERIHTVLDTHGRPRDADDTRTPAERQAEGLAEVCGYALAHAPTQVLPETGGRRPQLVVTIRLEDLERRARTAMLEFGGQTSPEALRMLACDAAVIPVVLGGNGEPLDIGRVTRTIPDGLRRAVTARDGGCAHPGCHLPPAWCQIHHIVPWAADGHTKIDNLVMVCTAHHRLVHHSGWEIHMTDGRPEFVPPGWIDPWRRPRRKPDLTDLVDIGAIPDVVVRPPVADVTELSDSGSGAPVPSVEFGPPAPRTADFADLDTIG